MAFFVVTYDLRKKGEFSYQELWDEFDRLDGVKFQESDYFLAADNTADQIKDHFKALVHSDDMLMVVEFHENPKYTKAKKEPTLGWTSTGPSPLTIQWSAHLLPHNERH
jgi:hypothetical protein